MNITAAQERYLLDVARSAIRAALRGSGALEVAPSDDPLLQVHAGCFVSLHESRGHALRGCIGRLQSEEPLIQTLVDTAAGVLGDPRFRGQPVTLGELPNLDLEISVLSPLMAAKDPLDFDPRNEGIYLTVAGRSGTFLPQVARQTGWTREQLLARLCTEKMGLPADAWRTSRDCVLRKYTAHVIGPVAFEENRGGAGGFGLGANNVFKI